MRARMNLSELIGFHEANVNAYHEDRGPVDDEYSRYLASKGIVIILELARRVKGPDSEDPKFGLLPRETSGREVAIRLLKEHMDNGNIDPILQGAY